MTRVLCFLLGICASLSAIDVVTASRLTLFGEPQYAADFQHFDYANPQAPKGGRIVLAVPGSYDNFNRYASRGAPAAASGELYDALFAASLDEPASYYPLIARQVRYASDYSWLEVELRAEARFHDGRPIRATDVVFSFNTFMTQGVVQFRTAYNRVDRIEVVDDLRARIVMKEPDRDQLFQLTVGLAILPQHYWQSRDLSEPLTEVPLASGPYRVENFEMGKSVSYRRVADYWAQDLPVNRGLYNFDEMRYDYYLDETVMLEAFKAGEYDFRRENVAKNWATLYTGPNFDAGYIVRESIEHQIPQAMVGIAFNVQRPFLADARVREALSFALDFEWLNANLFYNQYRRFQSYFQNSDYQSQGLPSADELDILNPLRGQIPERVFSQHYQAPQTDGSGRIRPQLRQALRLLQQAGWSLKEGVLHNREGQPMELEYIYTSPSTERVMLPVKKNLALMGVKLTLRSLDSSQYLRRIRERDFDMATGFFHNAIYPSSSLQLYWHSDFLDSTYNSPGVDDPAVDVLIEGIVASQNDPPRLKAYAAALDRVLLWSFYAIPNWYLSRFRVAYWDKFDRPERLPRYDLGLDSWWVDAKKAAKLPEKRR